VADNNEPTLRNALDAVNAGRKWTVLGMTALFVAVLVLLGFFFGMLIPALQPPGPPREAIGAAETPGVAINRVLPLKALWVSAAFQLFFVACGTVAVMLHVSRMTRAVLRAIESTRK
jgi:hypothetical protein